MRTFTAILIITFALTCFLLLESIFNILFIGTSIRPLTIIMNFYKIATDPYYFSNIIYTLRNLVAGVGLGVLIGMLLAYILTFVQPLKKLFTPYIILVAIIPKIILFPIFQKIFIISDVAKIMFIATLYVAIFIYFGVMSTFSTISSSFIILAQLYSPSRRKLFLKVYLPATFYSIMSNLRLSISFALVGAIFADMMVAPGVGNLILILTFSLAFLDVYSIIFILSVIAMLLFWVTKRIEVWADKLLGRRLERVIYSPF